MKKISKIWTTVFLVLILWSIQACYYDDFLPKDDSAEVGTVNFNSDLIPIFNASCNLSGCHSTGGKKPNLSPSNAYTSLINGGYINKSAPENSLLYQWMKGLKGTPMPVSGSNATYNAKVLAWLKQGALND